MNSRSWRRLSRVLGLGALVGLCGCGVQQRAAEKLVDPRLREQGVLVENNSGRTREGNFDLGDYRVRGVERPAKDAGGPREPGGPLGPSAETGRTRPTQAIGLRFELHTPAGAVWSSECEGQRRQPPDHDLAAVADELWDEVALRCRFVSAEQSWTLELDGDLASNILGTLTREDSEDSRAVEVLLWHELFGVSKRRLPASLGVIRGDAEHPGTAAALILDAPERAWLAPELDAEARGLYMATLVSLRLMPLGFEG